MPPLHHIPSIVFDDASVDNAVDNDAGMRGAALLPQLLSMV